MGSLSDIKIVPLSRGEGSKCDFGAAVHGLDVNNISDDQLAKLKEAIFRYGVVIIKGQGGEHPKKNWDLLERLDPEAPQLDFEDWGKMFHPTGAGIVEKLRLGTIPNAGKIHIIGKGYQGSDHYGLKELDLQEAFSDAWYSKPLPKEDFQRGVARFQSWHMDGPMYMYQQPHFSSFRAIKHPLGEQEVDWADGSGLKLKVKAGRTAFFSSYQAYDLLTEEEKNMADHSWAEYMFYPYQWVLGCRGAPNGLGVASEGREASEEDLDKLTSSRDPAWQHKYPLVWVNEVTNRKAFHVMSHVIRRLYIRHGPNETPKVIDNVNEIREFILKLQTRILRPEYIYAGPEDEGDHVLWNNWGVMHTKIDYPLEFGPRTNHQGWIPCSYGPSGPTPIPV